MSQPFQDEQVIRTCIGTGTLYSKLHTPCSYEDGRQSDAQRSTLFSYY